MESGPMSYYRLGAAWPRLRTRERYPEVQRRTARRSKITQSVLTPVPPDPVVFPEAGAVKPLVQRYDKAEKELRRFTEVVSQVVNTLLGSGHIIQVNLGNEYRIGFAPLQAARAPTASDDSTVQGVVPGVVWINTATSKAYICVDNTQGAAVWVGPIS